MILKLSIVGLLMVLIAVVAIVYYTQLEGFDNTVPSANATTANAPASSVTRPAPRPGNTTANPSPANAVTITVPINTDTPATAATKAATTTAGSVSPSVAASTVAPASASNLSKPTSVAPAIGTAGPAPYAAQQSAVAPNHAQAAAAPARHDVMPQVSLSDTGYNAMSLQQKSDLLSNIQKIFRNELLASRSTDASVIDKTASVASHSTSTQQGNEYSKSSQKPSCGGEGEDEYRCPKNPDGSCPPVPDMTQYIKKDAIPCWGCSIDY